MKFYFLLISYAFLKSKLFWLHQYYIRLFFREIVYIFIFLQRMFGSKVLSGSRCAVTSTNCSNSRSLEMTLQQYTG